MRTKFDHYAPNPSQAHTRFSDALLDPRHYAIDWMLVRAYNRLQRAAFERVSFAHEMSHALCPDGYGLNGCDDYAEAERDVAELVASKYGVTVKWVEQMVYEAQHQAERLSYLAQDLRDERAGIGRK